MWTPHRIRIDQKLEMTIADVSQFWHDGCVHDLPGPAGRRCDRKRSGEDNQTIQRQQLRGSQSGSLSVSILNHPGCLVQLQYWLRLLILPGCRLHRHCLGHQLLLLLSKTHIWLCFYILSHWLSWNSGNYHFQKGLFNTNDFLLLRFQILKKKKTFLIFFRSDCSRPRPTIRCLSSCHRHNFQVKYLLCNK